MHLEELVKAITILRLEKKCNAQMSTGVSALTYLSLKVIIYNIPLSKSYHQLLSKGILCITFKAVFIVSRVPCSFKHFGKSLSLKFAEDQERIQYLVLNNAPTLLASQFLAAA